MAYEKEREEKMKQLKDKQTKYIIGMAVSGGLFILFVNLIGRAGWFLTLLCVLLMLASIGGLVFFLRLFLQNNKDIKFYSERPDDFYRPRTAEERAEINRKYEEMVQKEKFDYIGKKHESGAIYLDALQNFTNQQVNSFLDAVDHNKFIKLEIFVYPDYVHNKDVVLFNVKAKCPYVYLAHWMEHYSDTSDKYVKAMDNVRDKYGSELGDEINYQSGLSSDFSDAYHHDVAANQEEGKNGLRRWIEHDVCSKIEEHLKNYNGIYDSKTGKIFKEYNYTWKLNAE